MNNLNAVEFAIKVTSFRKKIHDVCRKKGLEYPSDEKIAEWIDQKYGMENVDDFIKDYTEHEGIFRNPINDFKDELNKITWSKNPTEEEIAEFFEKNGNNVSLFCREHTIKNMRPLERETLLETLKLNASALVNLWNIFIEESAIYGADSYIYDLANESDIDFINKNFPNNIKAELTRITKSHEIRGKKTFRFFQWHNLNDNKIYPQEDIKGLIVAFWREIFERIMIYPCCYNENNYFESVFFPVVVKQLGYVIDAHNAKLTYKEK
jgi:hypothetical protein